MRNPDRSTRWALVILVGALALRLYGLVSHPFDQDELYTKIEAATLFDSPLNPGIESRPLYFLLHHQVSKVLPETMVGVRLPAFLFGIVGVWMTWVLGRRVAGDAAGLSAMCFVGLSPWHLYSSDLARYWSLVYTAAIVFWWLLMRAEAIGTTRAHLLALIPLTVGTLSHPTFVFPLPAALLVFYAVSRDGNLRWPWPPREAWIGLWLPFASVMVAWFFTLQLMERSGSIRNFDGRGLASSLRLLPAMVQWLGPTMAAAAVGGGLLVCVFKTGRRRFAAVALAGMISTCGLLIAASMVTNVYADYAMAALPFAFVCGGMLIGFLIEGVTSPREKSATAIASVVVVLGGVLPSTVSHLIDGTRFDYRPAFELAQKEDSTRLVLTTPVVQALEYAPALRVKDLSDASRGLDSTLAAEGDLWVIASYQRYGLLFDNEGNVQQFIARSCRSIGSWERTRIDYRSYRVVLYRCSGGPSHSRVSGTLPASSLVSRSSVPRTRNRR